MSVNIKYKNNSIATMSDTGTKTLKTSGKYCEADIIVENVKDGGVGSNVATGTFTPASASADVTVEHGLGVSPSTIIVVPMPTGVADKINPICFYIGNRDAGAISIIGDGSNGNDFDALSYVATDADTNVYNWERDANAYGAYRVQAVDAQKFVVKHGFGVRTVLWFAAV